MKKHSIAISEEVYDYLNGMIDDEHVSNSDDSEERNANGETVAHRPSFSEVISHLIEDRESEPRSWQITEERKAALAAMSNLSETISCPDCGVWIGFADIGPHMAVLRGMLEESQ